MKHETAHELLPWLLNGTLDSGERDDLHAHLEQCDDCRRELEETRQAMETFDQHLPARDLVARAEGRETEVPAEIVDAHLESCPECAEELALLVGSLRTYGDSAPAEPSPSPRRTVNVYWRHGALAATLVGLIATGGWIFTWQGLEASQPQVAAANVAVNVQVMELSPGDSVVRGLPEPSAQGAMDREKALVLHLSSGFFPEDGPFSMEVVDAEGNVLIRQEDHPWPELGVFTIVVMAEDRSNDLTIRIESIEGTIKAYHLEAPAPVETTLPAEAAS